MSEHLVFWIIVAILLALAASTSLDAYYRGQFELAAIHAGCSQVKEDMQVLWKCPKSTPAASAPQ